MPPSHLAAFKAYDIRGRIPDELNADLVRKIGRAYATFLKPKRVAVGYDVRPSSPELAGALRESLTASGVDVVDIGMCGTEQVYFATFHLALDGGVMVTASHNPADYNGLKLVREQAKPLSADTGLQDIERIVLDGSFGESTGKGREERVSIDHDYVKHVLSYVNVGALKPFTIVTNPGNGGSGPVLDLLEPYLPF